MNRIILALCVVLSMCGFARAQLSPNFPAGQIYGTLGSGVVVPAGQVSGTLGGGVVVPSTTVQGVTNGTTGAAGVVGQLLSVSAAYGGGTNITNNVASNVLSLSLTAGTWLCWGTYGSKPSATETFVSAGLSTTSASLPSSPGAGAVYSGPAANISTVGVIFPVGSTIVAASGSTTIYLVAVSSFASGANAAYGYIGCLRVY